MPSTNGQNPVSLKYPWMSMPDGLPDDEWYEIAGSEYGHAKTVKNYEITYYKPNENKVPTQ